MTVIDQKKAPFAMPALPWDKRALAPHISAETIDYHYGKHLQTYVNNLNNLVSGTEFTAASLEEIVRKAQGPIFNNAAQVWNHTLYFLQFSPTPKTTPTGALAAAIERDFGSFDAFREQFAKSALGLFGSGWTWLVAVSDVANLDKKGASVTNLNKNVANQDNFVANLDSAGPKLEIINSPNAGNPLTDGKKPLMVIDVWEHAYYIDHRNARAASIDAFWKILDWKVAENRY